MRYLATRSDRVWGIPTGTYVAASLVLALLLALVGPATGQDVDEGIEHSVPARLAQQSLLLDVASADGLQVAVGERGHILVSRDGAQSWTQAEVPTRATLTAVFLHDGKLGWVVGHDAVILRTEDGGVTWTRLHFAPEEERPLMDVWFSDAQHGFAMGAYGYFLETTDGGDTWSERTIGDYDYHLHHLSRSSTGKLYIAAEAGMIYRSEDDGASWLALPSPYGGSFFATLPLDEDSLLVFGLRGHLFRSDDSGETWNEFDTGTVALLTDGARLEDGTIVVVGLGGSVLVSRDHGLTFELVQQPSRRGISALVEAPSGSLILVGEFGVKKQSSGELTASGQ